MVSATCLFQLFFERIDELYKVYKTWDTDQHHGGIKMVNHTGQRLCASIQCNHRLDLHSGNVPKIVMPL